VDAFNAGHPLVPEYQTIIEGGSDASRIDGPIRDNVFDLTARHADIHELPVVQAV
jgi:hypothetical protein